MPAATELRGAAAEGSPEWGTEDGAGGSGDERGCAAEVESGVGGPSCVPLGGPRGEFWVLRFGAEAGKRRRAVVERGRRRREGVVVRRWRQRGQIMVGLWLRGLAGGNWAVMDGGCGREGGFGLFWS